MKHERTEEEKNAIDITESAYQALQAASDNCMQVAEVLPDGMRRLYVADDVLEHLRLLNSDLSLAVIAAANQQWGRA